MSMRKLLKIHLLSITQELLTEVHNLEMWKKWATYIVGYRYPYICLLNEEIALY